MLPDVHSKLVLESKLIWYTEHMCGIIDMSNIAIRRSRTDYHPTKHDSVTDDLCPNEKRNYESTFQSVVKSNQFT